MTTSDPFTLLGMIRKMEAADYPAWKPLWDGYLSFYRAEVPDDITSRTFDRLVQQADGMIGLVATGNADDLVGFAHLVFHPSTWSDTTYCYLEDLFVSRAARGTSIGQDLIEATYAEADRRGATNTYWQTQQYNGAARSLYDQVGHATSFIIYQR
jgi:GNAT superfamily N-acetyltransferase